MATNLMKKTLLCLLSAGAFASAAHAGGFSRGEADTDILYEDGTVVIRSGATWVSPQREFETTGGVANDDGVFSENYWIPSIAMKVKLHDRLACAFTYTQPFGADSNYGPDAQVAALLNGNNPYGYKGFDTNEYAATCDVNFEAGRGVFHVLGGGFIQDFSYTAHNVSNSYNSLLPSALRNRGGTLELDDSGSYGYRLGAAYEIKEYALRVQLMYRSQIDHETDSGSYSLDAFPIEREASGYGSLPQSLKLSVQTGVAPGWLVYGSVKWTDWSVLDALNYNIAGTNYQDVYNWRDGWTIQAGVAHAFTEKVAGTINVTWDKGVGTGADIMTDTWTVAAGAAIKAGPGELRFGAGISYMTEGSQSVAQGATYNATADGDWAYAVSGSYRISF